MLFFRDSSCIAQLSLKEWRHFFPPFGEDGAVMFVGEMRHSASVQLRQRIGEDVAGATLRVILATGDDWYRAKAQELLREIGNR